MSTQRSRPKVLVLGGSGMLGHKVVQRLAGTASVTTTFLHSDRRLLESAGISGFDPVEHFDVSDQAAVKGLLRSIQPDYVVNCVGIIKQLEASNDPVQSIQVNALFPHVLARDAAEQGSRVIHLSTDCVFSGRRGSYAETDAPDPDDFYGRSKLLGEIHSENALTLRTSVIGRELRGFHSLVEWFLHQGDSSTVRGYSNAIFSGLTNIALAAELARIIETGETLTGVYHLSAAPISKFELLQRVGRAFGRRTHVIADKTFACDRSLRSENYRQKTGSMIPSWDSMIADLASDPTRYPDTPLRRLGSG